MPDYTQLAAPPGEIAGESGEEAAPAEAGDATAALSTGQQEPGRQRSRKQFQGHIAPKDPTLAERVADIIDTATLCDRLGKSRGTIDNWRASGLLPYMQVGRSIMFSWTSVLEALKRGERQAE
jgi:hypothetical protein